MQAFHVANAGEQVRVEVRAVWVGVQNGHVAGRFLHDRAHLAVVDHVGLAQLAVQVVFGDARLAQVALQKTLGTSSPRGIRARNASCNKVANRLAKKERIAPWRDAALPQRLDFLSREQRKAMETSTWVIIAGVGLLLIPIPPFATIAGIITIAAGGAMKLFPGS